MPLLPLKDDSVIIVGAGVFGLSLAYELAAHRGYSNITVIDRHRPPVPDGSSNDFSRQVRSEYTEPLYARLGREAIREWRTPDWAPDFYETGSIMMGSGEATSVVPQYRALNEKQDEKSPRTVEFFDGNESELALKRRYPNIMASFDGVTTMSTNVGGWAHASNAIQRLANRCSLAGVSFFTGPRGHVIELLQEGSRVTGVKTQDGSLYHAKLVVLATGAWTNRLVSDMTHNFVGVGQPIGMIQLTPEEAGRLKNVPCIFNEATSTYCFPPTPDTHILKVARHGYGYSTEMKTQDGRVVSSPIFEGNNAAAGYLPADAERDLRKAAQFFWPEFGDRPWQRMRMCWYTDTPTGDFKVDFHPTTEGLFIATGGSGHAFKFLPIIGRYIADCVENKAEEVIREKWAVKGPIHQDAKDAWKGDSHRGGPPRRVLTRLEQSKL
ncbi:unnamed protein product [Penicillium salamii]|nr:unnamed protein product [Penicillium salamii]